MVASRLSLEAFSRQSAFNPRGGPAGVVSAVCAGMHAKLHAAAAAHAAPWLWRRALRHGRAAVPPCRLLRYDALLGSVAPARTH